MQVPRILIADDEETFLHSTAELLRREGYHCDTAPDGIVAAEQIRNGDYDLLIADIRMPGNAELQLLQELAQTAQGLPVILVTGYPSIRSAIQSVDLLVAAYLVKPVAFQELLDRVRLVTERYRAYRVVRSARKQLEEWQRNLNMVESFMARPSGDASHVSINAFVDLTLRNVFGALSDMKVLTDALTSQQTKIDACHLLSCPRPLRLIEAIQEAIRVLEKTKSSFKSKELGELRTKLEQIVREASSSAQERPGGSTDSGLGEKRSHQPKLI